MTSKSTSPRIAIVVPCYRVRAHVGRVLAAVPPEIGRVICVDDACPEGTADWIQRNITDPRVRVVRHEVNQGVGGAVATGYRVALEEGCDIVVKIDGDDQMDLSLLPRFVLPITMGFADYTKGNRFYRLHGLRDMPKLRLFGNAVLSFMSKLSTGYWNLFDPTNGYTAISADVLAELPLDRLARRYFFETDMLYHLNIIRAVVEDIPMEARYADEQSNLRIGRILVPFIGGHVRNFAQRFFYNYLIRDFSIASVQLLAGIPMMIFGVTFGARAWIASIQSNEPASAGSVMLAALPIIVGLQFLLSALSYDIANVPRRAITPLLRAKRL